MPKKTTLLIIILAVVTVLLVFLALQSDKSMKKATQTSTTNTKVSPVPLKKSVEKTATVYFSQNSIAANPSGPTSADIMVNSGKSSISGVQIELEFDPKVIGSLVINPPTGADSFFGTTQDYIVLFKEVNNTTGRATFAVAFQPQQAPKQGLGKAATVTFSIKPGATVTSTTLSFSTRTIVTKKGESESVLKATQPMTVTLLGKSSTPQVPATQ